MAVAYATARSWCRRTSSAKACSSPACALDTSSDTASRSITSSYGIDPVRAWKVWRARVRYWRRLLGGFLHPDGQQRPRAGAALLRRQDFELHDARTHTHEDTLDQVRNAEPGSGDRVRPVAQRAATR